MNKRRKPSQKEQDDQINAIIDQLQKFFNENDRLLPPNMKAQIFAMLDLMRSLLKETGYWRKRAEDLHILSQYACAQPQCKSA